MQFRLIMAFTVFLCLDVTAASLKDGLRRLEESLKQLHYNLEKVAKKPEQDGVVDKAVLEEQIETLLDTIDDSPMRITMFQDILEQVGARPKLPPRDEENVLTEEQQTEFNAMQKDFEKLKVRLTLLANNEEIYQRMIKRIEHLMMYRERLSERRAQERADQETRALSEESHEALTEKIRKLLEERRKQKQAEQELSVIPSAPPMPPPPPQFNKPQEGLSEKKLSEDAKKKQHAQQEKLVKEIEQKELSDAVKAAMEARRRAVEGDEDEDEGINEFAWFDH